MNLMKRLIDFVTLIMYKQCNKSEISPLAHQHFLEYEEQDTGVYAYDAFEPMDHHSETDLVVKFLNDNGLKIFASWQGINITIEANLPSMGWDHEDGEFGLGGDWWKRN